MESSETIDIVCNFVRSSLENAEAGHDWFHTERVWKLAKYICSREGGDQTIIEISALLHDIADPKFHNGDEDLAIKISKEFLTNIQLDNEKIAAVLFIIKHISFKNRYDLPQDIPLELKIVQDADRLDAIGAIGIARTFNFGGYKNNRMYDPEIQPNIALSKDEYKKSNGTTINHFYEKLLLLKDLMNTETAKILAKKRHDFMLTFLDEFYSEWRVDF